MTMVKYKDITKEMLKAANNSPIKPIYVCKYIKEMKDGTIITYNEDNAKFDKRLVKKDEMKTINTLKEKLGWNIEILYRINDDGVSTPDIRRICDEIEYWDIKNIYGAKTINSRKSKLKHRISKQCDNFIFDISNNECDLTNEEAIIQIDRIFNDFECNHVRKILLLGKGNFIKVFKRK